ncbi:unnamed protein product, partial [Rotaria magnacalcarata]
MTNEFQSIDTSNIDQNDDFKFDESIELDTCVA